MKFLAWVDRLFNSHKLMRRLMVVWACWLISLVVMRVTTPEVLDKISAPVASIVAGVIGILTTVIGLYQWSRKMEEKDDAPNDS